jgi:XTP/dITP diphosphohydrolase
VKILFATRNKHKIREVRTIFSNVSALKILDLDEVGLEYRDCEDSLEPFDTFEENAISKATYFNQISGLPTLSDDSGLVVDCLGGAPGVNSKRFSPWSEEDLLSRDESNNRFLVESLRTFPDIEWTARYVCVVVLMTIKQNIRVTKGEVEGRVLERSRGKGGFGYDPHFLVGETDLTFAEMSDQEKNRLSHRGKAFQNLLEVIKGDI